MSWVPSTDFEEEIVDLQPNHNFIFGQLCDTAPQAFYPRPKAHLEFVAQQKNEKIKREKNLTNSQNHTLNLIAKVQRIAGTKPLGEQPTIDDWNNNDNLERETIALMRHVGLGPSLEQPLDEGRTIATHPITEEVKINRNGRKHMPIFFDEKFFALKPRISSSPSSSGNNSPIMEGAMPPNESSTSQRSSSLTTLSDTCNNPSDSPISSFESAVDIVGDEESFETARNSDKGNSSRNWQRNKGQQSTENWRSADTKIKPQSWRNSNTKPQNTNGIIKQIPKINNCDWRTAGCIQRKEQKIHKKSPQICTPKELYEKKRPMI